MIGANPVQLVQRGEGRVTAVLWKLTEPQRLYQLNYDTDEYESTEYEYVETSGTTYTVPHETYVFACKPNGEWITGLELPGSFRGSIDHAQAIGNYLAIRNGEV